MVAIPSVFIFLQPNLGTMLVFGFIAAVMLFVAGTTWRPSWSSWSWSG